MLVFLLYEAHYSIEIRLRCTGTMGKFYNSIMSDDPVLQLISAAGAEPMPHMQ